MRKILIAQDIFRTLARRVSFLDRANVSVFTAATNDETLGIHRLERVHLIITELDMPGMGSEELCSLIRSDRELRAVSVLMVCPSNPAAIEKSLQCRVNGLLMRPVDPALLLAKAKQLLNVAWREAYRAAVPIDGDGVVHGVPGSKVFVFCVRDVSPSGMLIETGETLTQGEPVVCSLLLPGSERIEVAGEIVRTIARLPGASVYRYGVKFAGLFPEARRALETMIY